MTHSFTRHQILNITTGRLYTKIDDVYDFFNKVIEPGIMTHMLPNACRAILPILEHLLPMDEQDLRIKEYLPESPNPTITFEFTDAHKEHFLQNYTNLPSPLEGKEVITVTI